MQKLSATLNDSLKDPDVATRPGSSGMRLAGGTPKAYGERIHADIGTWQQIVKDASIPAE